MYFAKEDTPLENKVSSIKSMNKVDNHGIQLRNQSTHTEQAANFEYSVVVLGFDSHSNSTFIWPLLIRKILNTQLDFTTAIIFENFCIFGWNFVVQHSNWHHYLKSFAIETFIEHF